mgnify:CR=1 FL=1
MLSRSRFIFWSYCTHYEFIKNEISSLLKNCEIIDGSVGVSKQIIKSYKVSDLKDNKIRISKIFSTAKLK